jgi:hypothetical protein
MDILLIIRIINIILALTCIVIWIMFYKDRKMIGAIAPISWLFDFLVFSAWRFLYSENTIEILRTASVWTGLLCAHAIILLIIAVNLTGYRIKIPILKEKGNKQ